MRSSLRPLRPLRETYGIAHESTFIYDKNVSAPLCVPCARQMIIRLQAHEDSTLRLHATGME